MDILLVLISMICFDIKLCLWLLVVNFKSEMGLLKCEIGCRLADDDEAMIEHWIEEEQWRWLKEGSEVPKLKSWQRFWGKELGFLFFLKIRRWRRFRNHALCFCSLSENNTKKAYHCIYCLVRKRRLRVARCISNWLVYILLFNFLNIQVIFSTVI